MYESGIQKLAAAGVFTACDAPTNTLACPDDEVTRGEMADLLLKALKL